MRREKHSTVGALSLLMISLFAVGAAAQTADLPRAEYPRPQFERADWLNLNGEWEFQWDDADAGLREGWYRGERRLAKRIVVPFAFQSKLSGIGETDFHDVMWYRRGFRVPSGWRGKRVLLHFGAVDYRAQVWVNGEKAGDHEGGHVPFNFEITHLLNEGNNTLVVRAEDPSTDRFIPRGKQYWKPKSAGIFYTRTSGIWQTVWLEPVAQSFIRSVRITPDFDSRSVHFQYLLDGADSKLQVRARVLYDGQLQAEQSVRVVSARPEATLKLPEAHSWTPERPNLYDIVFELTAGNDTLDRVESYFGLRKVAARMGRVELNNRPYFLKFVLDQGYWPESLLTPPSDEAIRYDIKMTKAFGFNGARKHQKVEDPRYLYWADRMGLLVSDEMANAYEFSSDYLERFTREWMEVIRRDYNHPSVVIWAPINESWGVPATGDPLQQQHLRSLYALTRAFDNTRLVIDNDGWEHTDSTDLFAIHDYARNGEILRRRYAGLGKPTADFPSAHRRALIPGYRYEGQPIFLSEYGGIGYVLPDRKAAADAWGYSGLEPSVASVLARLKGLNDAIFSNPAFAGFCYTQITDVEQEVNGLMTYDRKPKFDPEQVKKINTQP